MKTWVPSLAPPHKSDTRLRSLQSVEAGRSEFKVLFSYVGGLRPAWLEILSQQNKTKLRYFTRLEKDDGERLRAQTAPAQDPGWVPSICVEQFTTVSSYSLGDPTFLASVSTQMHIQH